MGLLRNRKYQKEPNRPASICKTAVWWRLEERLSLVAVNSMEYIMLTFKIKLIIVTASYNRLVHSHISPSTITIKAKVKTIRPLPLTSLQYRSINHYNKNNRNIREGTMMITLDTDKLSVCPKNKHISNIICLMVLTTKDFPDKQIASLAKKQKRV